VPACTVAAKLDHSAPITAMSRQPGLRVATAAGKDLHVWRGGHLEAIFTGYTGAITFVGSDGDEVYALTDKPVTIAVDVVGAAVPRRIFRAGTQELTDLQFDRQRSQIIASSLDQLIYIWDAATGALMHKLEGTGPLWGVRTSPDGALVIDLGGVSPTVWDRTTGASLGQLGTCQRI